MSAWRSGQNEREEPSLQAGYLASVRTLSSALEDQKAGVRGWSSRLPSSFTLRTGRPTLTKSPARRVSGWCRYGFSAAPRIAGSASRAAGSISCGRLRRGETLHEKLTRCFFSSRSLSSFASSPCEALSSHLTRSRQAAMTTTRPRP